MNKQDKFWEKVNRLMDAPMLQARAYGGYLKALRNAKSPSDYTRANDEYNKTSEKIWKDIKK